MKRDISSELLKDYLDGDAAAEEELYARYDRGLQVPAELWAGIERQLAPVEGSSWGWWTRIAAGLVLAIGLLFLSLWPHKSDTIASIDLPEQRRPVIVKAEPAPVKPGKEFKKTRKPIHTDKPVHTDNPGVLSTDLGGFDLDEQDTAKHIEQTEILLRSIRNFPVSDSDEEIDVTYDKALSRRLLNENVVLRREAEMKAKFPTKMLLADLEPFLIDIANLPDRARPEDVRAIKERVQKTEIVAALLDYQDRGTNNR